MKNIIVESFEDKEQLQTKNAICFGTVISYSKGRAKIIIDGDDQSDGTEYVCIKSCIPAVNDRVFFMRTGSTLIIVGVIEKR